MKNGKKMSVFVCEMRCFIISIKKKDMKNDGAVWCRMCLALLFFWTHNKIFVNVLFFYLFVSFCQES